MSKRIITTIVVMAAIATNALAQTFTAKSIEGVDITFRYSGGVIIVGNYAPAIDTNTSGHITIPSTVIYNENEYPVTYIGGDAFKGCKSITSVSAPSCFYVRSDAFTDCEALTSVDLPECTSIAYNAFYGSGITNIDLPKCTTIGVSAFEECKNLKSVNIPQCTTIDRHAFNGSGITSIDLPACTEIGDFAFNECNNLETVNLYKCTTIGRAAFYNCTKLKNIDASMVTTFGEYAFWNCNSFTEINISACTSMGDYIFSSGQNIKVYDFNPTPVDLTGNNSFKYGDFELYVAEGMKNIYIDAGYLDLGFTGISEASSGTAKTAEDVEIGFHITDWNTLTAEISANDNPAAIPTTTESSITIPATIKYLGKEFTVTSIGDYAFYDCNKITTVKLPETITLIGAWAFGRCSSLQAIKLTHVEDIYNYAFGDCTALNTIVGLNNATYIESGAFSGCTGLITIILTRADAVANVNANMFKNIGENCTLYIPRGYSETLAAKGWTTEIFKGGFVEIGDMKGDVDNDGEVTSQDASLIQQKVAGKIAW